MILCIFLTPPMAWAGVKEVLCQLVGSPSPAEINSMIQALETTALFSNNSTVSFDWGRTSPGANADTSCAPNLMTSGSTCDVVLDSTYWSSVTSPSMISHEYFHAYCESTNCALAVDSLNRSGAGTGYSNTPSDPFNFEEVFTHYSDYNVFKGQVQDAIATGDQATAIYAANWATTSMLMYDNMYPQASQTLQSIQTALSGAMGSNAATLSSTGVSGDGQLHIIFTKTTPGPTGSPAVQISLKDPGAENGYLMLRYTLDDPSIAGGLTTSPNYAAGITFLQQKISDTSMFLSTLPSSLPLNEIYQIMAAAGYTSGTFDPIHNGKYYFDPSTGQLTSDITAAALIPSPGMQTAPPCNVAPPWRVPGKHQNAGIVKPSPLTGTFEASGGATASFKFDPYPSQKDVISGANTTSHWVLYEVRDASEGDINMYLLAPENKWNCDWHYFAITIERSQTIQRGPYEFPITQGMPFTPGTYDYPICKDKDNKPGTWDCYFFATITPEVIIPQPPCALTGISPVYWWARNDTRPPDGNIQAQIMALDSTGMKILHAHITGTLIRENGVPPVTFSLSY